MKIIKWFCKMFIFLVVLALGACTLFAVQSKTAVKQKVVAAEHKILYSANNAPIFYGATKITIDKNVTGNFSIKDPRFRIYAKDFEDGDLSPNIECTFNNVNSTVAGNYEIRYRVADSHNNEACLVVPVVVLDKAKGECTIERTLYTLPSDWNFTLINVGRNRNGDRQNLGIYLPADTTIKIGVVDADSNIAVSFVGNYEAKESGVTINKTQTEYITVSNTVKSISYSCVPFASSVVQAEGEDLNKTYKIEINFDASVKPLDYFLYKDNEDEFMANWKASQNDFGVVDCRAMQIIVPFVDIDKISTKTYSQAIGTLNESLEYFMKVIDRMDEILGVSINPEEPLDQNVRMKYFAKANGNRTSVGAYYTASHIAVGSSSVWPIFTYGWGTLHECGHGYQGYLGQGSGKGYNMCLNETGNNVFAHYVQSDKTIYKNAGSTVGKLQDVEKGRNQKRLNGEEIFNNANGTYTNTDEKLYMLINLFDSFEGYKTYAKLYKYYRKMVYEKGAKAYTIPEIYTKFFAETYNANIMPYLYAWKVPVGSNVIYETMQKDLKSFSVLADTVGQDNLQPVKDGENLSLSYGLIDDNALAKYNLKGNLKLTINLPEIASLSGKIVALYCKGKLVAKATITSSEIEFDDIDVGFYEIRLPVVGDYDNDAMAVSINCGENMVTYSYQKNSIDYSAYAQKLLQLGYYRYGGSIGFSIELSNFNKLAKIEYGGGMLLNQSGEWLTAKADETYISVKILDGSNNVVFEKSVKGNKEYFNSQGDPATPFVAVDYGYKVVIYTEMPNYVRVKSVAADKELSEYNTTSKNISYEITRYGFKLLNVENFDTAAVVYNNLRQNAIDFIESYKSVASSEELNNKRINAKLKNEIVNAYNFLNETDRAPYTEFVGKIKAGGAPIVKQKVEKVVIKQKEAIDLYSLLEIFDNEDLIIYANAQNVAIETDLDVNKVGEYMVKYTIKDADQNVTVHKLKITVTSADAATVDTSGIMFLWAVLVFILLLVLSAFVLLIIKRYKKFN